MRIKSPFALTTLAAVLLAPMAHAQAATPEEHPGYALAEAIAAQGCVLHQDDVNTVLESAGLEGPQFPQMALPLLADGILASTGNGTLTLVNWGLCTGLPEADSDAETPEDAETEGEGTDAESE